MHPPLARAIKQEGDSCFNPRKKGCRQQLKKTAVILDLGFVLFKLYAALGNRPATATEIRDFATRCLTADEELFRIYCYHCLPYGEEQTHPLTRTRIDFSLTGTYVSMNRLIRDIKLLDNVAFRAGELSFDGWIIKRRAAREIIRTGRPLVAADFAPDLTQKGVDMKIGLDVSLASQQEDR
jgi:uncharacterized LabA/DUF88 family protein